MIIEEIITIFVEILLIFLLSLRYIKRYAKENLVIIPLVSFFTGSYISFTINKVYIPLYFQVCIFLFSFILPLITIALQYNNIIIKKKLLYYRMKYLFISKEYVKTINYINKLVEFEGRKAEYLYILGMCYKHLDDFINARDSFALAIELDKKDYNSYYELGVILESTNKKETAMVMFNKAIRINPAFYEAREALGICLTRQGKFEDAVKVYKKALEKFPNSYEMYYNIAILELELGEGEEAKAAFKKAVEIRGDLYTAWYNLGNINCMMGEYDEAIEDYRKILVSGVYGPKAYFQIATVYAIKKEYEKAMAALEYAIELDPKYIKEAKEEYIFRNMQGVINRYLLDKEIQKNKENQKKGYIIDKLKLFKKKDILDEDYSKDYTKKEKEQYIEVKHA